MIKRCFLVFMLVSLFSFSSTTYADAHLFTMKGSNTVGAHLAPQLAVAFLNKMGVLGVTIKQREKQNEYRISGMRDGRIIYIDVHAHGSSTGYTALLDNSAQIALSSRPIKAKERAKLSHYGDMTDFKAEKIVAIDGLAIIVNKQNPILELEIETIAKIFSGEITRWDNISEHNGPISLYARDNNSGTWDTFKSLVLQKHHSLSKKTKRFESNDVLSYEVSKDINAIGFVGLASINESKVLAVSHLSTLALKPNQLTVATEDYPLSRRLYMYIRPEEKSKLIDSFIQFTQSNEGQKIVSEVGFISQNPIDLDTQEVIGGNKSYRILSRTGRRLSLNFRFKAGSALLDNKAQQDLLRLTRYLKQPELNDYAVVLVGFGDAKRNVTRADVLSKLRATVIKSALHKRHIQTQKVIGLGASFPVATNLNAGKYKNQRVEVWLLKKDKILQLDNALVAH